jgi:SAM-dependent methyltransferase
LAISALQFAAGRILPVCPSGCPRFFLHTLRNSLLLPPMSSEKQSEWFKTWFDSPYYHLLYENRDENEAHDFILKLCSWLDLKPGTKTLDLACGAGRHSRVMHQLGLDVSGCDLSVNSIAKAREEAPEGLKFFVHDMRNELPEQYEVVMNLFTSFGYFESLADNLKALQSIHKSLADGGILVIDFFNAEKVVREMKRRQEIRRGQILFHIKKDVLNGRIVKTIAFEADGESHFYQEKVQALDLVDFQQLLGETGFSINAIFGDYRLNPFDAESSDRLILICGKA